jgi:D-hexose-6-phosphate mutarotase
MPQVPTRPDWKNLRTEFTVTVSGRLTMELSASNDACDGALAIENCLHTYFNIGDISQISITGLKGLQFIDKVENFARKQETGEAIRIGSEVDRVFVNAAGPVEIHDAKLKRKILVEKTGSASCVVWNPWIAKSKAMADFGDEEYHHMVCVEAGNVGDNKISLAPGQSTALKVTLSSRPL